MDQPQNTNHTDHVRPAESTPPAANAPGSPPAAEPPVEAAPPLTPTAWLMNNAIYLIVIGLIIGFIWYNLGLESVWSVAKVGIGLGFVIFIHELGHFLAAKWCDVHVQTFSIGFGPALPGCSFQRGETTYKISVLPLGGYVNMVGEGLEGDEDENYPRSFKNKTVFQRMLIISAGVVMNVLLGCVLFIVVYYFHGVMEHPAVVGRVDAGSPMWEKGIPTGSLITDLDGVHHPIFKNLRIKVVLSGTGEKLPFTFLTYNAEGQLAGTRTVDLLPRKEATDPNPVVGVQPPDQLRLPPKPRKDYGILPAVKESPALAARPMNVQENEVIVAATDPDHPDEVTAIEHNLKDGTFSYKELSRRVRALQGKKMVIHVLPKGGDDKAKPDERDVPLDGFQWNDTIIGCTVAQDVHHGTYNPFRVADLPHDPRHQNGDQRDPFVFHARLRQLAGLPMIVRVRRGNPEETALREQAKPDPSAPTVSLFVPPAYHFTFGMRMKMGKVAGIRDNSPAAQASVQKGDELLKVVMTDSNGKTLKTWEELDPERLPFQLAQEAAKHDGTKKVILTVRRGPSEENRVAVDVVCNPVPWEENWSYDEEAPLGAASPLPIPQLGVAYWVHSQIVEVKDDSPAARAGLKKGDVLQEYRIKQYSPFSKEAAWSEWNKGKLESDRNGVTTYDRWAQPFWILQMNDFKEMQVRRPEEDGKDVTLTAEEDPNWPLASRGLRLQEDYRLQKADSLGDALVMGGRESRDMIGMMYLQLRSLLTGRVSVKQVGGPIAMLSQGFFIAQSGNFELLLFLGIISINLAVVNFLPIPILDGGHMVFLIYEKLRGRPPSEKVRAVATYIGLAAIGFLILFVFYQDFHNYVRGPLSRIFGG